MLRANKSSQFNRKHRQQVLATHNTNPDHGSVPTADLTHPLLPSHSVLRVPVDDSSGTSGPVQLTPQDSDGGYTLQSSPFTGSSGPAMAFTPEEALPDHSMSHTAGQAVAHAEGFSNAMQPREALETPQPRVSDMSVDIDGYMNFQDQPFREADPGE